MRISEEQSGYINSYVDSIEFLGGEYFDNAFTVASDKVSKSFIRIVTDEISNRRITVPAENDLSMKIMSSLVKFKSVYKDPLNRFVVAEKNAISDEKDDEYINKEGLLDKMPNKVDDSDVSNDSERELSNAMSDISDRIILSVANINKGYNSEKIKDLKSFVSEQVIKYFPMLKTNVDEIYSKVVSGLNEKTFDIKSTINSFDENLDKESELHEKLASKFL